MFLIMHSSITLKNQTSTYKVQHTAPVPPYEPGPGFFLLEGGVCLDFRLGDLVQDPETAWVVTDAAAAGRAVILDVRNLNIRQKTSGFKHRKDDDSDISWCVSGFPPAKSPQKISVVVSPTLLSFRSDQRDGYWAGHDSKSKL